MKKLICIIFLLSVCFHQQLSAQELKIRSPLLIWLPSNAPQAVALVVTGNSKNNFYS